MQLRAIALRAGSALLLAACGGGSGGGGQDTPELVITVADADVVAAEVMRGLVVSTDFANTSTGPGETAAMAALSADARVQVAGGGVSPAAVLPPTTVACAEGGTVTIAGDVAVPGTLTPGDELETDFDLCRQELGGPELTGMLDVRVIDFDGDIDEDFVLLLDAQFGDLLRTADGVETRADGRVEVLQDTLAPLIREVEMANGPITFTETETGETEPRRVITLTRFDNTLTTLTTAPNDYVLTGSGTLIGSRLGDARVAYGITEPLEGTVAGEPEEGELLIIGADDATILLTAQGTDVELEVDRDGEDGPLVPETQTLSWDALYAAEPSAP